MDGQFLLKVMQSNKRLRQSEEATAFLYALNLLRKGKYQLDLYSLFLIFQDKVLFIDALKILDSYIWSHDIDEAIQALLKATPEMLKDAPEWVNLFYTGLLKDKDTSSRLDFYLNRLGKDNQDVIRRVVMNASENLV